MLFFPECRDCTLQLYGVRNSPILYIDLTGNYTTAFNLGKRAEVHDRVKHTDYLSLDEI